MAKSEKADIWLPVYCGDYLKDTGDLTLAEHGAYFKLMMAYWQRGCLEHCLEKCMRIAGAYTQAEQQAVQSVVERFFSPVDGMLRNKRLDIELEVAKAKKDKAVGKAREAAIARWEAERKAKEDAASNAQSMPQAMPEEMLKQCPSPSPAPSPIQPPSSSSKPLRAARASRLPADWSLPADWAAWAVAETPVVNVQLEAAKFKDYWLAKSGQDATKNSWEATWRNWCRRVQERAGQQGNRPIPMTRQQQIEEANRRAADAFVNGGGSFSGNTVIEGEWE